MCVFIFIFFCWINTKGFIARDFCQFALQTPFPANHRFSIRAQELYRNDPIHRLYNNACLYLSTWAAFFMNVCLGRSSELCELRGSYCRGRFTSEMFIAVEDVNTCKPVKLIHDVLEEYRVVLAVEGAVPLSPCHVLFSADECFEY